MGTLPRCLCLILTLSMTGLRPSAGIGSGSPDSDPWWGTKDAQELKDASQRAQRAGDFSAVEKYALAGLAQAQKQHARLASVRFLITAGAARMYLFRYRSALEAFLEARRIARAAGNRLDEAAIEVNLSSLHSEMSDLEAALEHAERARALSRGVPHPYFEHQLLLQLGRICSLRSDPRAAAFFAEGIEAARALGDPGQEARGWEYLGDEWLRRGQLADADRAFTEAYRIRALRYRADLGFSYARLGALRLAQGRLDEALRLTQLAIDTGRRIETVFAKFVLKHQKGEIERARGSIEAALRDFSDAAELASAWRTEALPAVSTLTGTNVELEKRVFQSLEETAAQEALRREDSRLALKALRALEQNRAASLRETLTLGVKPLPLEYWDVLGELRAEHARLVREGLVTSPTLEKVRTKLTELEAQRGPKILANKNENFLSQNSLNHFQQVLSASELFLSFHLGEKESFLWTVTRTSFALRRLPPAAEIREAIGRFKNSVRDSLDGSAECAEHLYKQLFGTLRPDELRKPDWIVSADDALFQAPLAALVTERKGSKVRYLVEQHSLRLVPGAMSLADGRAAADSGTWLGVGDPIYNTADTRWTSGHAFSGWFASAATRQFNRLVGSADEIRASARGWGSDSTVLEGMDATRANFQAQAARKPSVIHLATHVLTQEPSRALIAFGLGRSGEPEFLTTADIEVMALRGTVVTMTGCATGTGEVEAGAGLLGLTRAWQIAGARAVIATLWPVADSRGELFGAFYRHLRTMPPAEAMRRSQVEMINSGAPARSWGAFVVTAGGSR